MIQWPTYANALLWAVCVPCVFAVVSDKLGMNRRDRLAILRVLWVFPAVIACAAVLCGALILITP